MFEFAISAPRSVTAGDGEESMDRSGGDVVSVSAAPSNSGLTRGKLRRDVCCFLTPPLAMQRPLPDARGGRGETP